MNPSYREKVQNISQKLVQAQAPIRILDAIKWDPSIEAAFRNSKFQALPKVNQNYYESIPLGFDPETKSQEITEILKEIPKTLGEEDDLGKIFIASCEQYLDVIQMLVNRGTKKFYEFSRRLYGSPHDHFLGDKNTILSLAQLLNEILSAVDDTQVGPPVIKDINAEETVRILSSRLEKFFGPGVVTVSVSDGIVADAAAGSSYIKINPAAEFSQKEIDVLEVHEGWVHVVTSVNGASQPYASWLSKGPPRCIQTQEGLAVLMEVLTLRSYPLRLKKISDRIRGIHLSEEGADFKELYDFYLNEGYSEGDAFRNGMRVCRGGLVGGGAPYTKDISYCRGFIENYNFLRVAIRWGKPELIRFLFVGKLHIDDVPLLYRKHLEGLIDFPKFLPPPFKDLSGLVVWMSFSNFLNRVNLDEVQRRFEGLYRKHL